VQYIVKQWELSAALIKISLLSTH